MKITVVQYNEEVILISEENYVLYVYFFAKFLSTYNSDIASKTSCL